MTAQSTSHVSDAGGGQPSSPPQPLTAAISDEHQQQPMQLFPKPQPVILPTFSSDTTKSTNSILPNINAESPLHPSFAATAHPHFAKGEGVKEPLPTDVICGRGKMTASHPANRRFRELVDSHKAAYQNSKRRDEKTRITCELVDKLRGEGRFVLFDPNTKLWYEVSEEYAREKVSHSLRSRSSAEQRIANAANTTMKMLNDHENNSSLVEIAPRAEGTETQSNSNSPQHTAMSVKGTAFKPYKIPDDNTSVSSSKSPNSNTTTSNKTISKSKTKTSSSLGASKLKNGTNRKKNPSLTKVSASKAHSTSSSTRSKHSALHPHLDEIVQSLIKDQQALLRVMIHKETERFTSAAAMGPPPRPMPLTYKAEASAVSTLMDSLPKMGTPVETTPVTLSTPASTENPEIVSTPASVSRGESPTSPDAVNTSKSAPQTDTPPSPTTTITV